MRVRAFEYACAVMISGRFLSDNITEVFILVLFSWSIKLITSASTMITIICNIEKPTKTNLTIPNGSEAWKMNMRIIQKLQNCTQNHGKDYDLNNK